MEIMCAAPSRRVQRASWAQENLRVLLPAAAARQPVANSQLHTSFPNFKLSDYPDHADTVVDVVEQDCIVATLDLRSQGFKTAMLNMASNTSRGGGFLSGATAQEEDVCLRTTLYPALATVRYPLPNISAVYTPGIYLIRDTEHRPIPLDPAINFNVISSAAINRPSLKPDGKFNAKDYALTKAKMELFFQTALVYGDDAVVPSAWGCGAYKNDPKWVARTFLEVLRAGYARKFRRIRFAIIGGGNYTPFAAEFAGVQF